MGWGLTSENRQGADNLQMGIVTVQSNATCAAGSFGDPFYPGRTCAPRRPGSTRRSCNGDSGGLLVENTTTGPIEIGIVSYGYRPRRRGR